MLVDVVLLRRKGLRLRTPELDPPVRGTLRIAPDSGSHSSFQRPMLLATLTHDVGVQQMRQDLLRPIWGVTIVQLVDGVLTIEGTELESDAAIERVSEHRQLWRCTVVTV